MTYFHTLRILIIKGSTIINALHFKKNMLSVLFGILFIKGRNITNIIDLGLYSIFSRNDKYYFIVTQRKRFLIFHILFERVDYATLIY